MEIALLSVLTSKKELSAIAIAWLYFHHVYFVSTDGVRARLHVRQAAGPDPWLGVLEGVAHLL